MFGPRDFFYVLPLLHIGIKIIYLIKYAVEFSISIIRNCLIKEKIYSLKIRINWNSETSVLDTFSSV